MNEKISNEKINEIYNAFDSYKSNKFLTTEQIANNLKVSRSTINNYFREFFKEEYSKIASLKSKTINPKPTEEHRLKISKALKGKPKPPRTEQHRINLSKAMSKSYVERFGEKRAKNIIKKISKANTGKKRVVRSESWRKNLSNSLKGRNVWNKGKKGLQIAWNKKDVPEENIVDLYVNKDLATSKISKKFNVSRDIIFRVLKEKNIELKGSSYFMKGKTYEELYGSEIASKLKENLSKKLKNNHPVKNWAYKISNSLKKYHEKSRRENLKIYGTNNSHSPEQRKKRSIAYKKYLREHPEELERIKNIVPMRVTSIEKRMLNFLKKINLKEGKDFLFDTQDISGKTLYRPDFQFPKDKIIIELNGYYKHYTKEGYQRDKIREYYLKKAGWKIYKFGFFDIDRNYRFEDVKEKIIKILGTKC